MFCYKCGAEMQDDAMFCSSCGLKLERSAPTPNSAASPIDASVYDQSSSPYSESPYFAPSTGASYSSDSSKVNNYLIWNVLATLFCCIPLGIVGIVFSVLSSNAMSRSDYMTGRSHASTAKTFFILSVVSALSPFFTFPFLGISRAKEFSLEIPRFLPRG